MGTHGIVRKIDELGRIVLPIEVRKKCGWDVRDAISVSYGENNTVILGLAEKYSGPRCVFCGADETAKSVSGKEVCGSCLENIIK